MTFRTAVILLLTGTTGAGGCSTNQDPSPGNGAPPADAGPSASAAGTTVQAVYDFGMTFGTTRREIGDRLGRPDGIEVELAENRHDPEATDSLFVLRYPGLRFSLNRPGPVGRDLLTEVALTDRDRELPGGIRAGSTTRAELSAAMGAPSATTMLADTVVLGHVTPNPGAEEFVQFYLVDGVVERIRWIPYVD